MCHHACLFLNLNIPKVVAKKEDPVFLLIPYFKGVGRLVLYGEILYCSTKIGLLLNLMFAVVLGLLKDFSIVYTVVPRAWTPPKPPRNQIQCKNYELTQVLRPTQCVEYEESLAAVGQGIYWG